MAVAYKTPGVYIVEKNAFPPSIVAVETAVPAFVGYTQIADNMGQPLSGVPFKITSMSEFETHFGGPPPIVFKISPALTSPPQTSPTKDFTANGVDYQLNQKGPRFLLYYCMRHFFQNGGGACYIVSVGGYGADPDYSTLTGGIDALKLEQEPTMLVIPDAVLIKEEANCITLQQDMLTHCGDTMRNRIAILDIYDGYKGLQDPEPPVDNFRNALGVNNLSYGAAYYPWLNTTVVQDRELSYQNFLDPDDLAGSSSALVTVLTPATSDPTSVTWSKMSFTPVAVAGASPPAASPPNASPPASSKISIQQYLQSATPIDLSPASPTPDQINQINQANQVNQALVATNATFNAIVQAALRKLNLLPPSAAMAGLYTFVDNNRGVWKAPANVSVNGVISPSVSISNYDQQDLNVTPMGKSINAIRSFIGEGVLVWGARTLDGNSEDWRYVNVRRTLIFLEESCRLAAKRLVFEPNVSGTWLTVRSMIENFLTSVWRQGGLAGAVPEDAFSVHVGLGETMTAQDILDGYMRITVLVAVSHPAEFIEITFQQQQQKS